MKTHFFTRSFFIANTTLKILGFTWAVLMCSSRSTPAAEKQEINATGTWKWSFTTQNGDTINSSAKLKQEGEKLTGIYVGRGGTESQITNGKVQAGSLSFKVVREFNGQSIILRYEGKLSGDTIKGKMEFERDGDTTSREWEAKREAAVAGAAGTWNATVDRDDGGKLEFTLKLKEENGKVTGTLTGSSGRETEISEGSSKDNEISFTVIRERDGRTTTSKFRGKRTGDTITGKAESDYSGEKRTYEWSAKRAKE